MPSNKSYNEAELNTLLESVNEIVLVGNQTEIYRCNKLALTFFKVNTVEEINKILPSIGGRLNIIDANTKEKLEFKDLPYNKALTGEIYTINLIFEGDIEANDKYLHCKGVPIILQKDIIGAVLIFTEYTYEKAAQEAIRYALSEVEEIKKLNKRLEKYSYAIAHDLNSPINNIQGLSYMLIEENKETLTPKMRAFLDKIYNSSKRVSEYVISLLKLSQLNTDAPTKEIVSLAPIIEDIIELSKNTFETFTCKITYDSGMEIFADKDLAYAVFQNVITNAIKFSSENVIPMVHIGFEINEDDQKVIYVKDNGIGFTQSEAELLFIPKTKTPLSSKFSGYGIGLTTVQHIINSHGGRIWGEGIPGKGATFYLYFPPSEN